MDAGEKCVLAAIRAIAITGDARMRSPFTAEDQRRIRCLKIVEHVYWSGTTSLQELSATLAELSGITETSVDVVEQDIAVLRHDGLPMSPDEAGRWRIDAVIPGAALRLTKAQASIVWAWCVTCRSSDQPVEGQVPPAVLSEAVAALQEGLRRFHKGSEVMNAASDATARPIISPAGGPEQRLQAFGLVGEARLVNRRLRILDLIEGRKALNTSRLVALLDVSQRTVHGDLNVLRYAGLKIRFCRRCHEFQTEGLNSYLAGHLTLPMAAALLALFEPTDARDGKIGGAVPFSLASKKLARSIRLIFARQAADLQDLVASYRASEPVK